MGVVRKIDGLIMACELSNQREPVTWVEYIVLRAHNYILMILENNWVWDKQNHMFVDYAYEAGHFYDDAGWEDGSNWDAGAYGIGDLEDAKEEWGTLLKKTSGKRRI